MDTTSLNLFTVKPNSGGTKWVAAGTGNPRFSEEYDTRDAAFAAARVHARGHLPSQVSVYKKDGTIERVQTFGTE
jgi:hypothetical protein